MADGCFILQDDQAQSYSELWSVAPVGTEKKGDLVVRQDVVGFYLTAGVMNIIDDTTGTWKIFPEVAVIYKAQQVRADKVTGTGYNFVSGDRVYYRVADKKVTPTHAGTIGTDFYYVGTCKKTAATTDTTVLINFDGTMYSNVDMI